MKLNQQLFARMREATQHLLAKGPAAATMAIQQALAGLRPSAATTPPPQAEQPAMRDINPPPGAEIAAAPMKPATPTTPTFTAETVEVRDAAPPVQQAAAAAPIAPEAPAPEAAAAIEPEDAGDTVTTPPAATPGAVPAFMQDMLAQLGVHSVPSAGLHMGKFDLSKFDLGQFELPNFDLPGAHTGVKHELPPGAQFINGSYTNHAGTRSYKLYIPSSYHGQAMPLLVMLHGCTQDPDDFAAGTQMNAVAEEKHCFVVYPAQSMQANNHKCWNWFSALDQQRGQGEPSIIAGIAQQVIAEYPVDERQVYVAGLSAGGAMAVIAGTLYPDLFAAVGVHSGLPYASAQDLPSALSAMKRGASGGRNKEGDSPPIIVFHGDQDRTVHPRNGEQVMEQKLSAHGEELAEAEADAGSVPNGHRYTRTTHRHVDGTPLGEHWVVHGAGHAWSGGSAAGSYTDGKGPDASREMMRFFRTVGG
jgi:poly(hydroxyalkanoate) depolymerase family esterase